MLNYLKLQKIKSLISNHIHFSQPKLWHWSKYRKVLRATVLNVLFFIWKKKVLWFYILYVRYYYVLNVIFHGTIKFSKGLSVSLILTSYLQLILRRWALSMSVMSQFSFNRSLLSFTSSQYTHFSKKKNGFTSIINNFFASKLCLKIEGL